MAADREKLLITREVVESARAHQAHDSLFQGNQLGHALDGVAHYPGALPADVVQVIEASRAARDAAARRARIRRLGRRRRTDRHDARKGYSARPHGERLPPPLPLHRRVDMVQRQAVSATG